jgi:hypothetical protein
VLPPAIEGWLTKRGHRNKRSWKTRWFEAYPGYGGCIRYFRDEKKTKLIGTIPLSNATVRVRRATLHHRHNICRHRTVLRHGDVATGER